MKDSSNKIKLQIKAILSIPTPESKIYHSALATSCQIWGDPLVPVQIQWLGNQNADTSLEGMVRQERLGKLILESKVNNGSQARCPCLEEAKKEEEGEEDEGKTKQNLQDWVEAELTQAMPAYLSDPIFLST